MRKISSRKTFFYKKVFPVLFLLIPIVAITIILLCPAGSKNPVPHFVLAAPLLFVLFAWFLLKKLVFDLMDEVCDDGNRLIVKNGDSEDVIALSNIINVSHSIAVNPARIVLTLRMPCRFGKKVAFCPRVTWSDVKAFGFTNALADELIDRVDQARRSA